jgi:hypothetical protein
MWIVVDCGSLSIVVEERMRALFEKRDRLHVNFYFCLTLSQSKMKKMKEGVRTEYIPSTCGFFATNQHSWLLAAARCRQPI